MPADSDLLFGKIAVAQGFCTQEQVDQCIRLQETAERTMPLGWLLVDAGFITQDQHSKTLEIQRRSMSARAPLRGENPESMLFGKLVIQKGLLKEAQVNECLREQARPGEQRSLGEIMAAKRLLSPGQVKTLLAEQSKRIMHCPTCRISYTILSSTRRRSVQCPRCKGLLDEAEPGESTRTDADLETATSRSLRSEQKDATRAGTPTNRARIKGTCTICSEPFESVLDSTGRVQCPSCLTRFVVKQTPPPNP